MLIDIFEGSSLDERRDLFNTIVEDVHRLVAEKQPFDPRRVTATDKELLCNSSREPFLSLIKTRIKRAHREWQDAASEMGCA